MLQLLVKLWLAAGSDSWGEARAFQTADGLEGSGLAEPCVAKSEALRCIGMVRFMDHLTGPFKLLKLRYSIREYDGFLCLTLVSPLVLKTIDIWTKKVNLLATNWGRAGPFTIDHIIFPIDAKRSAISF